MPRKKQPKPLKGVVFMWFETGQEGVYLAFNDESLNTKNTTMFVCAKCRTISHRAGPDAPHVEAKGTTIIGAAKPCAAKAHDFKLEPPEFWSYSGLHTLKPGDRLTILSKAGKRVVWNGVFRLDVRLYHALGVLNPWKPRGVPAKKMLAWFTDQHPARLIPARPKK